MVSVLDRKLLRDLRHLVGQIVTIGFVVACGIASYVTMRSAFDSLVASRDAYYDSRRFADVFAHLARAPESLSDRIRTLPGVAAVETRIVEVASVPMPGMLQPAIANLVSLPRSGEPTLGAIHLTRGRVLDPSRAGEILLLEAFAEAHSIELGDTIPVVVNGVLRPLRVVGVAMSPEFVFTMAPGSMTHDPKATAVIWMVREALAPAFRLEGAFNDVLVRLQPGADEREVVSRIDALLAPWGGVRTHSREKQASHFMLTGELGQLEGMATVVPAIFLCVAAFLLNVVLSRLVHLQRGQIATLKAVGYSDLAVGTHYLKLVGVVVAAGALLGVALGAWLGRELTELYTDEYFRFPDPRFRITPAALAVSIGISAAAAAAGALAAVRAVTTLPPAEAMRPPSPAVYSRSLVERLVPESWLGPAGRLVVRDVGRRPLRLVMSSAGIGAALGIVVVAGYYFDAVQFILDVQFHRSMREDVTVGFVRPLPERAIRGLSALPGVWLAEGQRSVPVRFRSGHRHRDAVLVGHADGGELRRLVAGDGAVARVPARGLVLTTKLAEILDARPGTEVEVEVREGQRRVLSVPVAALVDEPFGLSGHASQSWLSSLLREEPRVTSCLLRIDEGQRDALHVELSKLPWVASVSHPGSFREQFEGQSGAVIWIYTLVLIAFASTIAIGIVYNNARVALSQKSRDLASLRVLGFTRREIAGILFGELSVQVLLAVPLGLAAGWAMVWATASTVDPETYRLPVIVTTRTFAYAVAVTVLSAVASALLVRRKLDRLDLVGVLKTRE